MKTTKEKATTKAAQDSELKISDLLHEDHQKMRELFFDFSQTDEDDKKAELVKTILKELYVHAKVEEEIVYPAIRDQADDVEDMMDEADTEHHVVKLLMAELAEMKPGDDHYDSKVTVLCELVNHHVREEEKEIFDKMDKAGIDEEALANEVLARKAELNAQKESHSQKQPIKTTSRGRKKIA